MLILLTLSAMLQMAVQFLQPALVAVRRHRALVIAWLSGGLVFGLAFLIPVSPIDRGVIAQLAGPMITLIIEILAMRPAVVVSQSSSMPGTIPGEGGWADRDDRRVGLAHSHVTVRD